MTEKTEDLIAEQIERAAKSLFENGLGEGDYTWAELIVEDPSRADIRREDARRALTAAGVAPQGSAAAAAALCDEVITIYEGNVGTHGPECYRWHAGCLALRVRQALGTAEFHGPVSARWLAAHDAEVAEKRGELNG